MQLKRSVFQELDAVVKPGCVLASNTATLSIGELAGVTKRPRSVFGLHFFSISLAGRTMRPVGRDGKLLHYFKSWP